MSSEKVGDTLMVKVKDQRTVEKEQGEKWDGEIDGSAWEWRRSVLRKRQASPDQRSNCKQKRRKI